VNPKISIVLATFNHIKYLPLAVNSILTQTFEDFELIIVNDGSTDKTKEYLDRMFCQDRRVRVYNLEKNIGVHLAYKKGFELAQGRYETWISSDNVYYQNFISDLLDPLKKDRSNVLSYSAFEWIDEFGNVFRETKKQKLGVHRLMIDNPGMAAFMYRREIRDTIGGYDPIGPAMDTDFWLRIVEYYGRDKMTYVDKVLCQFRFDQHCESYRDLVHNRLDASIQKMVNKTVVRRKLRGGNRPIRVLFIVPNFLPYNRGGVENYTYLMARELFKNGIEVDILHRRVANEPSISLRTYDYINVYEMNSNIDPLSMDSNSQSCQMEDLFQDFLDSQLDNEVEYDVIHFHHFMGMPFSLADIAKRCGYPVVIHLHDYWMLCHQVYLRMWRNIRCGHNHEPGPRGIDDCVDCVLKNRSCDVTEVADTYRCVAYRTGYARSIMNMVDLVIAVSDDVATVFKSRGFGEKNMIISNPGVYFDSNAKKKEKEGIYRFIYFGKIHDIKGVFDLAEEAVKKTESKFFMLDFYGEGSDSDVERLKEIISKTKNQRALSYMGPYNVVELPGILSLYDIAVLPSKQETYGMTRAEADINGIPIVSGIDLFRSVVADPKDFIDRYPFYFSHFHQNVKKITDDALEWKSRYLKLKEGGDTNGLWRD